MTSNLPTRRGGFLALALALVALQAVAENPKASPHASTAGPAPAIVGLPDLVLEVPSDQVGWPGFTGVRITVRNVGSADSTKATLLRSRCVTEVGSKPRCGGVYGWGLAPFMGGDYPDFSVPPLHKGESFVTPGVGSSEGLHYSTAGGDYRVRFTVIVDPDNLVAESNEQNNTSTFTRSSQPHVGVQAAGSSETVLHGPSPTSKPGASQPASLVNTPALFPPALTLSVNPQYAPGTDIWLVAKNNNSVTIGAGTAKLHCEGLPCSGIDLSVMSVPALPAGQWQTLGKFRVSIHQQPGDSSAHTVTITTEGVASKALVLKYP